MGLILTVFALCVGIAGLTSILDGLKFFTRWRGGIILGTIFSIVVIIVYLGVSYTQYLYIRAFYTATKEQYKSAITLLNKNVLEVYYNSAQALTDFTGREYTKEISNKIDVFRTQVVNYNRSFIQKKIMGRNWFFKGLVVQPDDDMKIIRLMPAK